jgi:hypothetical protein
MASSSGGEQRPGESLGGQARENLLASDPGGHAERPERRGGLPLAPGDRAA